MGMDGRMDVCRHTHVRARTYIASFVSISSPAEDVLKDRRETWKLEILSWSLVWMPKRQTDTHTNTHTHTHTRTHQPGSGRGKELLGGRKAHAPQWESFLSHIHPHPPSPQTAYSALLQGWRWVGRDEAAADDAADAIPPPPPRPPPTSMPSLYA
ncbi:uncharacterized protein K489DRAFT_211461 [Dissoconium aciculare CBS 342.82]|uniref:Uncharacterized protein n=1 Tax=Dissoconium aciculare CBS 342.82 TaxID=1314786 RepID=A0A6J3M3K8_9PEZI|nr:uncharacterized protein K489DRAFT_211461 [Dissoconium aciculare CBS 342.82]KAF1822585.1 hypothetical protein K489DRAFT_211461 [Dissoconium aciculare CBS 342.82]